MFRDAKVGDRIFDILLGWGVVENIDLNLNLPLRVKFDVGLSNYTLDGKTSDNHIRPRLYWDEIKFKIPERPFDLGAEFNKVEIMTNNYEDGIKFCIFYNKLHKIWMIFHSSKIIEHPINIVFSDCNQLKEFKNLLNEHKITPEQLRPLIIKKINEVYGE